MTAYHDIKTACETILSRNVGSEVEIHVRLKNFDKKAFIEDCHWKRAWIDYKSKELTLTCKDKDPYYLALKICLDKYPFVNERYFAEAFGVKQPAINKAKKKIEQILKTDENFRNSITQLQE
jgi:hypothetical protein